MINLKTKSPTFVGFFVCGMMGSYKNILKEFLDEIGTYIKFILLKRIGDNIMKQILTTLIIFSTLSATTIHVPTDDYPTIQAGIDASADGDTVLV